MAGIRFFDGGNFQNSNRWNNELQFRRGFYVILIKRAEESLSSGIAGTRFCLGLSHQVDCSCSFLIKTMWSLFKNIPSFLCSQLDGQQLKILDAIMSSAGVNFFLENKALGSF